MVEKRCKNGVKMVYKQRIKTGQRVLRVLVYELYAALCSDLRA